MSSSAFRLLAAFVVGASLTACSDSPAPSGPRNVSGPPAAAQLLPAPTLYNVVTRDVPLTSAQTATATVGLFGGQIVVPGTGLRVIIPPFALTTATQITVTAVAGREVAYEFEPHGTQFLVPVLITQNLTGTSGVNNGQLLSAFYGGYFPDLQSLNQVNGTAVITELFGTSVSVWNTSVSFAVTHFSGYLVATGETGSVGGEGSQ